MAAAHGDAGTAPGPTPRPQEAFELPTPDTAVALGYQIVVESGKPALLEVDAKLLQ